MSMKFLTADLSGLAEQARDLAQNLTLMAEQANQQAAEAIHAASEASGHGAGLDPLVIGLTVFVLACFVGYHVVWNVTPALHSPLMGVTNAVSSVIIVGAMIAAGPVVDDWGSAEGFAKFMGFLAVTLAAVNIFGGFIVTRRMLSMFKKKK